MAKETEGVMVAERHSGPTLRDSLQEYGRGIAGGLLFSLPLLYTMEVWWLGFIARPHRILAALVGTYLLLLLYNRFAGLREGTSRMEIITDSLEELGIGLLLSAFVLALLGRVSLDLAPEEAIGKIVVESMAVAIGVSVGTAQLGAQNDEEGKQEQEDRPTSTMGIVALSLCGAVLVGANVAPTEEIVMLAVESSSWNLLAIVAVSLLVTAGILHYVDFRNAPAPPDEGRRSVILSETCLSYASAIVASAAMLWFFGRFEGAAPIIALAEIVVLGLPAAFGASAGRLLIKG